MSSLQKSTLIRSAMAGYALPPRGMSRSGAGRSRQAKDFSPLHWSNFFAKKEFVEVESNRYCTYSVLPETPDGVPIIVLLHGGGFSALSWAVMAKVLSTYINVQIIAFDLRGHGETITNNDDDLSVETLSSDVVNVLKNMRLNNHPLIIMGHSLGGSLAVHSIQKMYDEEEVQVLAAVVIDVVEGSAMESLSTMHSVLRQRPKGFASVSKAIEWAMKAGVIRNYESARVSMAGQLKNTVTDEAATLSVQADPSQSNETTVGVSSNDVSGTKTATRSDVIQEESEESGSSEETVPSFKPPCTIADPFIWRIDLHKTEPFWQGWFKGMSNKFLSLHCPKLLMLAGVDRLDRDLTVGQMQGKFQMHVIANVGHAVHEDSPEEVAESVCSFLVRHKLVTPLKDFTPVFPGC